jgi:hypothetical protein
MAGYSLGSKISEPFFPSEAWQKTAGSFCDMAHEQLLSDAQQLVFLEQCGIAHRTIRQYSIGFNAEDMFRPREIWGLPTEVNKQGNAKKLWLPAGLVVPYIIGRVCRIRIRKGQGDWYLVPGSSPEPMLLGGKESFIIVRSELDGLLVDQEAGDIITAIALGNHTIKPTLGLFMALKESPCILVALDHDGGPGAMASQWWLRNFRQATRWPVPEGSNVIEAFQAGVNIRDWVQAGLPPAWTMPPMSEKNVIKEEAAQGTINSSSPAVQETAAVDSTRQLYELLKAAPVKILKHKKEVTLKVNERWQQQHPQESSAISRLVFMDDNCWAHIRKHPAAVIDTDNFFCTSQ